MQDVYHHRKKDGIYDTRSVGQMSTMLAGS